MINTKEVIDVDKKIWHVDILDGDTHLLQAIGKGMSIGAITMSDAINSDKYDRESILNELYNVLKGVYDIIESHYHADKTEGG